MHDIQTDAAPVEVCEARAHAAPRDIQDPPGASADVSSDLLGAADDHDDTQTGPGEVCDAHPRTPAPSTKADPDVAADILLMEKTVGQYIRDNGNPQERYLYDMLKN